MNDEKRYINPRFKKSNKTVYSASDITEGLKDGKTDILSYAITLAESNLSTDNDIILTVLANSQKEYLHTKRIAITGPPGAGKSTFIDSVGSKLIAIGKKIAVISIDPSSPESKGSILGDKTRMESLSSKENAFIRPSPSGLKKGGISQATRESILLCELAGFEYIFVETVGVGQSEYEVSELVDMNILLIQAGSGDDLQGIKRGIMERADTFVINKNDGENIPLVNTSKKSLDQAKQLLLPRAHNRAINTLVYSAIILENCDDILTEIEDFDAHILKGEYKSSNRIKQDLLWFRKSFDKILINLFQEIPSIQKLKSNLQHYISTKKISSVEATQLLKDALLKNDVLGRK